MGMTNRTRCSALLTHAHGGLACALSAATDVDAGPGVRQLAQACYERLRAELAARGRAATDGSAGEMPFTREEAYAIAAARALSTWCAWDRSCASRESAVVVIRAVLWRNFLHLHALAERLAPPARHAQRPASPEEREAAGCLWDILEDDDDPAEFGLNPSDDD